MNRPLKFLCVDFQREYTRSGMLGHPGYVIRRCKGFITQTLVPFFRDKDIKIAEIISDYRQPRPGDTGDMCHPGTEGYLSDIPDDVKHSRQWVKCMNSPLWTRENIGEPTGPDKRPGLPYQDPRVFNKWLGETIGYPNSCEAVVLFGLTLDCCLFLTATELSQRAYNVKVLEEATDEYYGEQSLKKMILNFPPLTNWASPILWNELKNRL